MCSRTSFTKGMSEIGGGCVSAILELEINKRASTGSAQAHIQDHEDSHADSNKAPGQNLAKTRFIEELVKPDERHQRNHKQRDLRVLPGGSKDAVDDEQRIF